MESEQLEAEWREHKKEIVAEIKRRREAMFGPGVQGIEKMLRSFGLNLTIEPPAAGGGGATDGKAE